MNDKPNAMRVLRVHADQDMLETQHHPSTSLYRSIIEATEEYKYLYGVYPKHIIISSKAQSSFVSGIIQAMLKKRGITSELDANLPPYHLRLTQAPLEQPK